MNFIWKIVMTVVIIIVGIGAGAAIPEFFKALFDIGNVEWYTWLWTILVATLAVLPAWYIWKGTKLIPLLTNIFVRIIIMVTLFLILPLLAGGLGHISTAAEGTIGAINIIAIIGFGLIGVWFKS